MDFEFLEFNLAESINLHCLSSRVQTLAEIQCIDYDEIRWLYFYHESLQKIKIMVE